MRLNPVCHGMKCMHCCAMLLLLRPLAQVWEEELLAHELCEEVRRQGAAAMRVCTPRPAPAHMGAVSTSIPMHMLHERDARMSSSSQQRAFIPNA